MAWEWSHTIDAYQGAQLHVQQLPKRELLTILREWAYQDRKKRGRGQMSYQRERDQFVARMGAEGLPLHVTEALLRAATTLQRYAELACSSEAADRDRVPCPAVGHGDYLTNPRHACLCDDYPAGSHAAGVHQAVPRITVQADRLEQRIAAGMPAGWRLVHQGDPRGYVLQVIPPSYAERNQGRDRFNLDTIGVPTRESRLRF